MASIDQDQIFDDVRGCPTTPEVPADRADIVDPAPFVQTAKDGTHRLELMVRGAHCAGCLKKIESGVSGLGGVTSARLNLSTGKLAVGWDRLEVKPIDIVKKIVDLGYQAAPFDISQAGRRDDDYGKTLLRALAVAGFAMGNIMLLSVSVWSGALDMGEGTRGLFHWISAIIAVPVVAYSGRPFFSSALTALKNKTTNMDVPISLAVLLAMGVSFHEALNHGPDTYFDAAVMLLFFLLIGRYLDHRLRAKARESAQSLLALQSVTANRLDTDGHVVSVAARDIEPGDTLVVFPGDRIPVNARVIDGYSDLDVSLVTGETVPVVAGPGTEVYSGIRNLSKRIKVEATSRIEQSLVAELARLIETGEQSRNRYVRLADKIAAAYVPIIHGLALATFLGWLVIGGADLRVAVLNAVAVLIIACPCALGLAVPAVQVVATGRLFKAGILVKSGDALERLAPVDHVVFDKTGTLTKGRFEVTNLGNISEDALARAAMLARSSRHPAARAIAELAGKGPLADDISEQPGLGIKGKADGTDLYLGSRDWITPDTTGVAKATELWFRDGANSPVCFELHDALRSDAVATVKGLHDHHIVVDLLSGDTAAAVEHAAQGAGIASWYAAQKPQQKIDYISSLKQQGANVLMVGDGLNDAPALAAASVSMSPGTAAEAAQSTADFVFQGDSLSPVTTAIDIARQAHRRVIENFSFAGLYNAIAIPFAMAGFINPMIAALAMSGSSLVVTTNALRIRSKHRAAAKARASQSAAASTITHPGHISVPGG